MAENLTNQTQTVQSTSQLLQPDTSVADVTSQQKTKKRLLLTLVGVFLVLVLITAGWLFFGQPQSSGSRPTIATALGDPSPTPMPFREMTIPYLREREYKSALTGLEEISSSDAYMTYLTSYISDGNRINAMLTKPTGEEPAHGWPAIVFVHGYIPPTQYQTLGPQYADYVDYLGRNGFVVMKIDLRGHADSEGEPGGGYYGSDYIADALHAYAALQSTDFVNPKSIGMWGHSMAGNTLMRALAAKTDIPATVIWAGAVYTYEDMRKYGIDDNSYRPPTNVTRTQQRRRELFEKQGSPSASSPFWQQVAPTNYLDDIQGAIEIHHAVDDDVVNVGYSRDLMALLDKTDVEHELYEYPTGGHNISGPSFVTAMQRTVEFYKKHLSE